MSQALELALKKQRLMFKSAALRQSLAVDAEPLLPLFAGADRIAAGVHWIKHHPREVGTAVAVLAVLRPRIVFRWARRGFLAWKAWQKLRPGHQHGQLS